MDRTKFTPRKFDRRPPWNSSPHRNRPTALRGLKVSPTSTVGGWVRDEVEYTRRTGSFEPELVTSSQRNNPVWPRGDPMRPGSNSVRYT